MPAVFEQRGSVNEDFMRMVELNPRYQDLMNRAYEHSFYHDYVGPVERLIRMLEDHVRECDECQGLILCRYDRDEVQKIVCQCGLEENLHYNDLKEYHSRYRYRKGNEFHEVIERINARVIENVRTRMREKRLAKKTLDKEKALQQEEGFKNPIESLEVE